MTKRRILVALAALFVLAAAVPTVRTALAEDGNWRQVTFIFHTDVKGKIEPCG
jgi:hypothetical protein